MWTNEIKFYTFQNAVDQQDKNIVIYEERPQDENLKHINCAFNE